MTDDDETTADTDVVPSPDKSVAELVDLFIAIVEICGSLDRRVIAVASRTDKRDLGEAAQAAIGTIASLVVPHIRYLTCPCCGHVEKPTSKVGYL
jgi:hypothetical protein